MPLSRRQAMRMLGGGVLAGAALPLLAACQSATNPAPEPKAAAGADLTALQASSELALGRNRFAIGLLDARNQPVTAGTVKIEYFKLKTDGTGEKKSESAALFRSVGGQSKGVWVASPVEFAETGPWGAQVSAASGSSSSRA